MVTVRELDGDEDLASDRPAWDKASWCAGFDAATQAYKAADRDYEHRCKRTAFELNVMRGTGVIDMPKLARILEGK